MSISEARLVNVPEVVLLFDTYMNILRSVIITYQIIMSYLCLFIYYADYLEIVKKSIKKYSETGDF